MLIDYLYFEKNNGVIDKNIRKLIKEQG